MTALRFFLVFLIMGTLNGISQNLAEYRWKNRIVLLFDTSIKADPLRTHLEKFVQLDSEMEERDLLLLMVTEAGVFLQDGQKHGLQPEELYKQTGVGKNFQGVVLIGKDGGVKSKTNYPVEPQTIFSLVDGMPMRKAEMRTSKID